MGAPVKLPCLICGMVGNVDPWLHRDRYGHQPEVMIPERGGRCRHVGDGSFRLVNLPTYSEGRVERSSKKGRWMVFLTRSDNGRTEAMVARTKRDAERMLDLFLRRT